MIQGVRVHVQPAAPIEGPTLVEARCVSCQKRLFDFVNAIREGRVLIRKRCRHCRAMNEIEVCAP